MTDEQKAVFAGHTLTLEMHINAEHGGTLIHTCKSLGLTRIIQTPRVKGEWGEQVTTYMLDGDEVEYTGLPEVADAIIARRKAV